MANAEFKLKSEQTDNVTIFHISGWLDAQAENALVNAAQEAHANGTQRLIIEMAEVEILTSAGVRALQKIFKLFHPEADQGKSTHFKLSSAPAQVYQVLAMTGFLQSVPMYENLSSAIKSFN
jgi:anti-anti-sigma factor